jgi:hypothetical protein
VSAMADQSRRAGELHRSGALAELIERVGRAGRSSDNSGGDVA